MKETSLRPVLSLKPDLSRFKLKEFEGKLYVHLDDFRNANLIIELATALQEENNSLRERIKHLEDIIADKRTF